MNFTNKSLNQESSNLSWIKLRGLTTKLLAKETLGVNFNNKNFEKWFTFFNLKSDSIEFYGIMPPQQVDLKKLNCIGYLSCKIEKNAKESVQNFFIINKNDKAFDLFLDLILPGNSETTLLNFSKDFIEDSSISTMVVGCTEFFEYRLNFSSRKIPKYLNTLADRFKSIDNQLRADNILPVEEFSYITSS